MKLSLSNERMAFVFGSNLAGRHGRGAALSAKNNFGARYGFGEGFAGRSYALPTKDKNIQTRNINDIRDSILKFIEFSKKFQEITYLVSPIGCGLAGYKDREIAPFFKDAPVNCLLPSTWNAILGRDEIEIELINDIGMSEQDFNALQQDFLITGNRPKKQTLKRGAP